MSKADEVIELMQELEMPLDKWQEEVLYGAMEWEDGWVNDEVGLIVPRQNGKTHLLLARVLWGLLYGKEKLILYSAHQFKTAGEAFRMLVDWCQHPFFKNNKPEIKYGRGTESVTFNGHRVALIARSSVSGRGFSPDLIIADEAFSLTDLEMASIKPSMSARKNPQLWYSSSAPHDDSSVLRRICLAGRAKKERLAYFEYCADYDADPNDREQWKKANPAMGTRLTERFTEGELVALSPEDFARERLGIWYEEVQNKLFDAGVWEACVDHVTAPKTAQKALAVDVAPDRRKTSIGAAALLKDGRILVEVIQTGDGVLWAVDAVKSLMERHKIDSVTVDGAGQSQTLIAPLEKEGIKVNRITANQVVGACGSFYDRVVERRLAHLNQASLSNAVEGAKQRELGDGWAWNRRKSSIDISPLVAVTLAAYTIETAKKKKKVIIV